LHRLSYLQYKELHASIQPKLFTDDLSLDQVEQIIQDINIGVGLILDKSEPISVLSNSFQYLDEIACYA